MEFLNLLNILIANTETCLLVWLASFTFTFTDFIFKASFFFFKFLLALNSEKSFWCCLSRSLLENLWIIIIFATNRCWTFQPRKTKSFCYNQRLWTPCPWKKIKKEKDICFITDAIADKNDKRRVASAQTSHRKEGPKQETKVRK